MTDAKALLQLAARCRHLAGLCSTVAVARKFEALALDYEEHARLLKSGRTTVDIRIAADAGQPRCVEPSTPSPRRAGAGT